MSEPIVVRNASKAFDHLYLDIRPSASALRAEITVSIRTLRGQRRATFTLTPYESTVLGDALILAGHDAEVIRAERERYVTAAQERKSK